MATIRRATHQLPGLDPRSPMTLTIPQHQILTSFQSLPSPFHSQNAVQPTSTTSPYTQTYSPSPFTFRAPQNTPISPSTHNTTSRAQFLFDIAPSPVQQSHKNRESSLKFLLQTGRVPSVLTTCPCGNGRKTTTHILKSCPQYSHERVGLLASSPRTPMSTTATTPKQPKTPNAPMKSPNLSGRGGMKSPRSPAMGMGKTREQRVIHVARKWRMRALLGRYRKAVQLQRLEGFGRPSLGLGMGPTGIQGGQAVRQKSPRPDVVELGLVGGNGLRERLERGVRSLGM